MSVEDDGINNDIAEDCNSLISDDSWSEKNLGGSSSGNKDVNDVHLDIDSNNDKLKLVTAIGQSQNKKHGHEYLRNCCEAILRFPR